MKNIVLLFSGIILFTSVLHVDSSIFSIFGAKKDTQFTFRTFFEGDWKLQKKTAAIIDGSSSGVDNPKETDDTSEDDEEDLFGALPSDSDGEDGEITFQVAFYSLRSDNLTNALVGKYYEEEYINAEKIRHINMLKLRVRYDGNGNSGSFLTGENNAADDGDGFDEESEDSEINSNMATLFDFDFKKIPALLSEGNQKAPPDIHMSEGYWHGEEDNCWYQFIITRPDQFILSVHPIGSSSTQKESITIVGTKYFGAGAVSQPGFLQKYFPTIMIVFMMVIRNCIKPNSAYSGRPTGPIRTPGAERTAGMKEPTKENQ